jgi:hypothetical protein
MKKARKQKRAAEEITFEKELQKIGYSSIAEFIEIACAMGLLFMEEDEVARTNARAIAERFILHCGHLLETMGHVNVLAAQKDVQETEDKMAKEAAAKATEATEEKDTPPNPADLIEGSQGGIIIPNFDTSALMRNADKKQRK